MASQEIIGSYCGKELQKKRQTPENKGIKTNDGEAGRITNAREHLNEKVWHITKR